MRGIRVGWLLVLGVVSPALAAPFLSQKYRFSITPPAKWTQANVPGFAAEFFFAPQGSGEFRSNFNVLEPIPMEGTSPAEACSLNVNGIREVLPGANIRAHRFDARMNVCHIEYSGSPQGTRLDFYAQLHFPGKVMYTLTFTAPSQEYVTWLPQVKAAFASFRTNR